MARAVLTDLQEDLNTDSGAVLWSIVRGEQLEFPITLNFLANASSGYEYEAVVVEAFNVVNQEEKPTQIQIDGSETTLVVRVLTDRGTWDPAQAYNREEFVYYLDKYYKLSSGTARVSDVAPSLDPLWILHTPNIVYIQFPSSLGVDWQEEPGVTYNVYGYFELRVTEPADAVFRRTFKPVRGMVELLFSPTEMVV
jgi:hypothetical protein